MDENNGKQQNQGAVDYINSGYNKLNNAKNSVKAGKYLGKQVLKQLGKQAAKKGIEEGAVAAGGSLGLPAIVLLLISVGVLVFVVMIVSMVSPSAVNGGDLTSASPSTSGSPNNSPGPTSSTPPGGAVTASNVVSRLKSDFNVAVSDTSNLNYLVNLYNGLAVPFRSAKYKSLMQKAGTIHLLLTFSSCQNARGSTYETNGVMYISLTGFESCSVQEQKFSLVHETGHVIGIANGALWSSFPYNSYLSKDAGCYVDGFLKSYPYLSGIAGTGQAESFAEAVADTVFYNTPGRDFPFGATPLTSFPTQCPNTYNWMENNIFGNVSFPQPAQ